MNSKSVKNTGGSAEGESGANSKGVGRTAREAELGVERQEMNHRERRAEWLIQNGVGQTMREEGKK